MTLSNPRWRFVGRLCLDFAMTGGRGEWAHYERLNAPEDLGDWCARAAYEVGLHTHDVVSGLGVEWEMPSALCSAITSSPSLWMFDSSSLTSRSDPWSALLEGSGRLARS